MGAEKPIRPAQATSRYSWMRPPRMSARRSLRLGGHNSEPSRPLWEMATCHLRCRQLRALGGRVRWQPDGVVSATAIARRSACMAIRESPLDARSSVEADDSDPIVWDLCDERPYCPSVTAFHSSAPADDGSSHPAPIQAWQLESPFCVTLQVGIEESYGRWLGIRRACTTPRARL